MYARDPRTSECFLRRLPVHTEENKGPLEYDRLLCNPGDMIGDSASFPGVLFWHWKLGSGGERKGPVTLPNDISLIKFPEITLGCWEAEIKLLDTRNFGGPR